MVDISKAGNAATAARARTTGLMTAAVVARKPHPPLAPAAEPRSRFAAHAACAGDDCAAPRKDKTNHAIARKCAWIVILRVVMAEDRWWERVSDYAIYRISKDESHENQIAAF